MFNSVNNPFGQKIESAISTGQEKRQQRQDQQQEKEKRYLENDDKDEVKIGGLPILTEEEILALTKNYINNLNLSAPKMPSKFQNFVSLVGTTLPTITTAFNQMNDVKASGQKYNFWTGGAK